MSTRGILPTPKPKPIIKWAGGKYKLAQSTLIPILEDKVDMNSYDTYVEPFLGGGGMLFAMLGAYPHLKQVYASDLNSELINMYQQVKLGPVSLKKNLDAIESAYNALPSIDAKKELYLRLRKEYNETILLQPDEYSLSWQASLFIALNKLGFNGLYRVNKSGLFNIPFGQKEVAKLYDEANLLSASAALGKVNLRTSSYLDSAEFASPTSYFYFDSPYKPVSATANFTSYTLDSFDDDNQRELADLCKRIVLKGGAFMLSNSKTEDSFFDELYANYSISTIPVRRSVGAGAGTRKEVMEIVVLG